MGEPYGSEEIAIFGDKYTEIMEMEILKHKLKL